MEGIFRDEGLPVELTRLPLIESCFDLSAYSKAGAAGIWQFMPATGRRFMRIDTLVDERRDPITSTRAAARFLRQLHVSLGTWPLAITGYNHGPEGIARAVRATGTTDIAEIIRDYRGRAFGFASRNFYAEFLAALDVERERERYYGGIVHDPPSRTHELRLTHSLGIEVAARLARTEREELARLNPALSRTVVRGTRAIPAGYRLRLPEAAAEGFDGRLAEYAAEVRVTRAAGPALDGDAAETGLTHRVQRGETASEIARRYGISTTLLLGANRVDRPEQLGAGRLLTIPSGAGAAGEVARTHRVRRGETASVIAHRYGVATARLLRANRIGRPERLRAGQLLTIPGRGDAARVRTHRVQRGQTLSHIARQHNVSVARLRQTNGISDPGRLRPGQVLRIPLPQGAM
jgi:membrane-bound lytic murein transglycosylase D